MAPRRLHQGGINATFQFDENTVPEECCTEVRRTAKRSTHNLVVTTDPGQIGKIINCEDYSSFHKLLRITALVMKFIRVLKDIRASNEEQPSTSCPSLDADRARALWAREIQARLPSNPQFSSWKHQFGLFLDDSQVWRCKGRLSNSTLPVYTKYPILLDKNHYLTHLIVQDAHKRVFHNGVKETLTEVRFQFWLVQGRQFVRMILHRCVVCRKTEGKPFKGKPSPPLPECRVSQARPFQFVGVYIKPTGAQCKHKVWLCLFTCCTTSAVHLELAPNLNAFTFVRCFKRFTARRGIPSRVISDNAKTFKSAARMISKVFEDHTIKRIYPIIEFSGHSI